jgi:lysophospholipase L1-like esterase
LGTNDAKEWNWNEENFLRDYKELVGVYKSLSSLPVVYISTPPPLYHKGHGIRPDIINDILPVLIPKISSVSGATHVDVFSAMGGSSLFKLGNFILSGQDVKWPHDGCHPNDFGYFDIANEIAMAIFSTYHRPLEES